MGLVNQNAAQQFPFAADEVFRVLVDVLPPAGYKIVETDRLIRRITASAPLSLMSWGENIAISVHELSVSRCEVVIGSALKMGANIAGAHRNHKNIDKIVGALSKALQKQTAESEAAVDGSAVPAIRRQYAYKGYEIDEFDSGAFIVHTATGPLPFLDRVAIDAFFKAVEGKTSE